MAKKEIKPVGPVIHAPPTLNGKIVSLVRGGKKVRGVLMSQDGQNQNDNLVFKWNNEHGVASISPLMGEELEELLGG